MSDSKRGNKRKSQVHVEFAVGEHAYRLHQPVFASWQKDDPFSEARWYAAYISGLRKNHFLVEWGEGGGEQAIKPEDIVCAKSILQEGIRVSVHDSNRDDFYLDVVLLERPRSGHCLVQGRKGVRSTVKFDEMMLDSSVVELFQLKSKKKPLPPDWMLDFPTLWREQPELFLSKHTFCFTMFDRSHDRDRERVEDFIICHGGIVVKTMNELINAEHGRFRFLLTPDCFRTPKYMQALAASVPCVAPRWITDMEQKKTYLDFEKYRLPTGYVSGVNKGVHDVVDWKPRVTLLNNLRVGLIGDSEFCGTWMLAIESGLGEPTIFQGETENEEYMTDIIEDTYDIIMVHSEVSEKIWRMCDEAFVPVVTQTWMMDTLIHGRKQPFDLPDFVPERYAYSEGNSGRSRSSLSGDSFPPRRGHENFPPKREYRLRSGRS